MRDTDLRAAPSFESAAFDPGALALSPSAPPGAGGAAAPAGEPQALAGLPDARQLAAWAHAFFRGDLAPAPATPALPPDPLSLPQPAPPVAPAAVPPLAEATPFYFLEFAHVSGARPQPPAAAETPREHSALAFAAPAAAAAPELGAPQFDAAWVARDFPILQERVNGRRLVWLDSAATTQKPQAVLDRLAHFYAHENSNVHRGAHTLAARSTDAYEGARERVRRFLRAPAAQDIVFVRGATEGINLVAQSWGRRNVHAGDEILISALEHHSNIVPWQQLCAERGARLRVAPIDDRGQLILEEFERLCGPRTRLVSVAHVSNALGTVLPVRTLIEIAQRHGARVLVDGAQAVSHLAVDVQALGCDFYVFSGHKVFGPTGIGALYGRSELLAAMPPWQGGGSMVADVTFERTVYQAPPARFEAGTGNIADAAGLGAALDYLERLGLESVRRHEHELLDYGTGRLLQIPRLRLIGTAAEKAGVLSFVIDGIPPEEIGSALAREGIAVRAGHHCAQPTLRRFGLESSVRASLALYNTRADLDALADTLERLQSHW